MNVFLTGKAGTGKTTFLRRLKERSPKRMVVVAPTGVAAINAGGVTIHSFFQFPLAPYIPGGSFNAKDEKFRFSKEKKNIIRTLDLLVIDEISMVRADIIDFIDSFKNKGGTVFVASHNEELFKHCSRIYLLKDGMSKLLPPGASPAEALK